MSSSSTSASAASSQPALTIRDLTFKYATAHSNFTLNLPALDLSSGDQMILAATSGKGKSTLLALIAGLMEPASGSIKVSGTDVHSLSGAARDAFRGRHIGMIFQTFNLLRGFTALENVLAALMFAESRADPEKRASGLLKSLGIEALNAPVESLSVGQQQRVAIARAVACQPSLVLADEPTASLDPTNALAAMDLIQSTCRENGAALLCVSHDPAMFERFALRRTL
jgi:ABC-type lipoprotein export system ATPase subunit